MSDLGDENTFPQGGNSEDTQDAGAAVPVNEPVAEAAGEEIPAENELPPEEVFPGEAVQEDILQGEVVQEDVLQDEVLQSEVVQEDVLQEEVLQGEVVQSEVVQEDVLQGEVLQGEVLEGEIVGEEESFGDPDQPAKAPKYVGAADDYDDASHVTGCSITEKLLKQAEKEKEFKKSNRKGRLWSILLMLSLIFLSLTSCGLLIRTTIQVITYYSANEMMESEAITGFLEDSGYSKPIVDFAEGVWNFMHSVSVVVGVVQWVVFIISLLITIGLLIIITRIAKKQSAIHEELLMLRAVQPPQVRRFWYVLLAWILGNFGLHLFMTDQKKRGVIFLLLGIAGLFFWPISLYTMAVSFYDGMASMYLPKESNKKVTVIISTGVL